MATSLSLKSSQIVGSGGRKRIVKRYGLTLSGNYANSGTTGDLLVFQTALNPNKIERVAFARVPDGFAVRNPPAGWVARIEPGTTFANWGIRFFQSDDAVDPLDEHADAGYAATITGSDGAPLEIELSGPAL
jgi:hypothetical protein